MAALDVISSAASVMLYTGAGVIIVPTVPLSPLSPLGPLGL